jgi:hypothetical protein
MAGEPLNRETKSSWYAWIASRVREVALVMNSRYVSLKRTCAGLHGEPVSGQPCHSDGMSLRSRASASAMSVSANAFEFL